LAHIVKEYLREVVKGVQSTPRLPQFDVNDPKQGLVEADLQFLIAFFID
jgi:hypothetical protein